MPSSSYAGTMWFSHMVYDIGIKPGDTVLDIGCGVGRFGFTVRDLTDFNWGNFKSSEFQVNLIGVDIWEPYLQEVQKAIYTALIVEDTEKLLLEPKYGLPIKLTMLSHVLEHMDKAKGLRVLELSRKISEWVIVNIPIGVTPQEPVFGNTHEAHISGWTIRDLEVFAERVEIAGRGRWPNGIFLMKGIVDEAQVSPG